MLGILEPNSEHISLDNFEFDWAYAGSYGIFPFEISYPEEPNRPMRCLANKLDQAVMKHLPFSALIISSLINSVVLYYFAAICGARLQREYYLTIRGARSTCTFVSLTCGAGNQEKVLQTELNCRKSEQ